MLQKLKWALIWKRFPATALWQCKWALSSSNANTNNLKWTGFLAQTESCCMLVKVKAYSRYNGNIRLLLCTLFYCSIYYSETLRWHHLSYDANVASRRWLCSPILFFWSRFGTRPICYLTVLEIQKHKLFVFSPSFSSGSGSTGIGCAHKGHHDSGQNPTELNWTPALTLLILHFKLFKRSSQTMNFSDVMPFNVLIINFWRLYWTPAELQAWGSFGNDSKPQPEHRGYVKERSTPPFFSPPHNRAHPQQTHPLPALDQQTWEASPPGLEGRMNTMINMFSRPLVFMTLTFNYLLMTSG